jgi:hypothetical protein
MQADEFAPFRRAMIDPDIGTSASSGCGQLRIPMHAPFIDLQGAVLPDRLPMLLRPVPTTLLRDSL